MNFITQKILIAGLSFIIGAGTVYMSTEPKIIIQIGDVPDLIKRLKPVTKERYNYTLGTDVRICFEGDVAVEVKLNMKNNNEYSSKAKTLREAVAGITTPSDEIRNALQGWGN